MTWLDAFSPVELFFLVADGCLFLIGIGAALVYFARDLEPITPNPLAVRRHRRHRA